MKKIKSTLCYIENENGQYLMLHRTKKKSDVNQGKWIGVGGKFKYGETPEQCVLREVKEETGLVLTEYSLKGIVRFLSDVYPDEDMYLFKSNKYEGTLLESCDEGDLQWISKTELLKLPMWEGDAVFLPLLNADIPFFKLKLQYESDTLVYAELNGEKIKN